MDTKLTKLISYKNNYLNYLIINYLNYESPK